MIKKRAYQNKSSKNKSSYFSRRAEAVDKRETHTHLSTKNTSGKRDKLRLTTINNTGKAPRGDTQTNKKKGNNVAPTQQTSDRIRLNKYIANSGVGSRRQADELIRCGLISVNKKTIMEMGHKILPSDIVCYEGKVLRAEKPVYILLNKPKGFITTTTDSRDRKTVMSLLSYTGKERLYPVGRLDRKTTGLLLLTNDGELANQLMHPVYCVKKIYKATLDRPLTKNDFQKILQGVWLDEGKAQIDELAIVSTDKKTIGIELHIGWNRIIHRVFGALGYKVLKLDRTIYAVFDKKNLPRGKWRMLTPREISSLKQLKKQNKSRKKMSRISDRFSDKKEEL